MTRDDIDAAVEAGILSAEQGNKLQAFLGERQPRNKVGPVGQDEPFRVLRNFNEAFLSIGVILILFAVITFTQFALPAGPMGLALVPILQLVLSKFIPLLITIALAELLAKRMRTVAPSILLAISTCYLASTAALSLLLAGRGNQPYQSFDSIEVAGSLAVGALAGLFYLLRYRLPFAALIVAACSAAALIIVAELSLGLGDSAVRQGTITLIIGAVVFAAALAFDFKDPLRRSSTHQIGFWLHIIAAPLMVHSIFLLLSPSGRMARFGFYAADMPSIAIVLPVFAVLTAIALAIDRRAILVASLTYVAGAVAAAISKAGGADVVWALTPLILGVTVLILGAQWHRIRRTMLDQFPPFPYSNRLPPWKTSNRG